MEGLARWGAALVTGATSGIGRATARALAPRVERLLVHGPEAEADVAPVLADLEARLDPGSTLRYLRADYRVLAAVGHLADEVHEVAAVELLVNNAGMPGPAHRQVSVDGNELTLQVDYLAPVALAARLAEDRPGDAPLRIVNVASATHLSATLDLDDLDLEHGYSPVAAYARAKLALVTHTCWLGEHAPAGVEAVSVHPGVIGTDLLHAMFTIGGDPPDRAAGAIVAVSEHRGDSGTYYDETRPADPHPSARDPEVQRRLRDRTVARLAAAGLAPPPP